LNIEDYASVSDTQRLKDYQTDLDCLKYVARVRSKSDSDLLDLVLSTNLRAGDLNLFLYAIWCK